MNYLVTGGCGFIGCHIIRQLQRQGHTPVCYDLHPHKTSIEEVLTAEEIERLTIVEGGLDDRDALARVMCDNKVDAVIHMAALLGDIAEKDPYAAFQVNVLGLINVFEAAIQAGVKRVVWAASQSSFGTEEFYRELYPGKSLVPNDAVMKPSLVYGETKVACEFLGEWYHEKYGLETIGLRYCMVFGLARMRGNGQFATELMNKPALGEKGVVNYGDTAPCWIYVEDAARAAVMACQCPDPKSRAFTIGGDIRTLSDLRDYVLTLLPDAQIELLPGKFPAAFNLDISAAKEELGFECEYSVEEGTRITINLLRAKHGLPSV